MQVLTRSISRSVRWLPMLLVLLLGVAPAGAQPPAATTSEYELAEAGQVSASIYDDDGRLVRELLRGQWQQAGRHELAWDGLDRDGNPMPAGEYEWRMLRTPGFMAEFVTQLVTRVDSEPYHLSAGTHTGLTSVAVDRTGLYAAAVVTETAPVLLKQSMDGSQRHWTRGRRGVTRGRYQGGISLASDRAGRLFMLQQNGYLQVIDAETGERLDSWDVLPRQKNREEEGLFIYRHGHGGSGIAELDMDARGGTIVISEQEYDRVVWLDPATGEQRAAVEVASPWGVAVGPDERVYVISEQRVLRVTPDEAPVPVITSGLEAPRRLAVDEAGEHLLVAERAPSHQIKRFSMEGDLLSAHGRRGGRRDGPYEPGDFLNVTDIAADGAGGFVIAEGNVAPRRVSRFSAAGELVHEWYGGGEYYSWGEPDPRQPSRVWCNPGSWLMLVEVDYDTGQWRVLENHHVAQLAGGMVRNMTHQGRWRVLYRDAQRYLVAEGGGGPQVLAHREGKLIPVTVVGNGRELDAALELADVSEEEASGYQSFRWLDENGDGEPQPKEFTFSGNRSVPAQDGSGTWVDRAFAYHGGAQAEDDDGTRYGTVLRTEPTWTAHGPRYPIGDESGLNEVIARTPLAHVGGVNREHVSIGGRGRGTYRDSDGNIYLAYNARPEAHGSGWPTFWGGQTRFVKFDADGREQWSVGRHAIHGGLGPAPGSTPPGYLHVPIGGIGEAHDTVILSDRVETPAMAWTKDGLYAGSFFDRRIDDGLPDTVYSWWRDPQGNDAIITSDHGSPGAVIHTDEGDVLWFAQGRNSVCVYKVHGWTGWQRESGMVRLDQVAPHARAEGEGLRAAYHAGAQLAESPQATRIDEQVWHGIPRGKEGNHNVYDIPHRGVLPYDWSKGIEPLGMDDPASGFAVRWSGQIEAPLSETFIFSTYARGRVRVWLDGEQIVFGWNQGRIAWESEPIALQAGERYDVQVDFASTHPHPAASLNWESPSIDRRRIAQRYLYPVEIDLAAQPEARPAGSRIEARTFDETNIETDDVRNYTRGLRQRGIGKTGAYLGFHRIDFGGDMKRHVKALVSGRPAGDGDYEVTLEFRVEAPDGPVIAEMVLNRDGRSMTEHTARLQRPLRGEHDVYVVNATRKKWHFVRLSAFWFE
ncbi:MAG: FlgD immunoglobulin-like domain containing protein [Phycisphaeraceae bacterium]